MIDDPLEPRLPIGITRGLIRHRDKAHVGSIWLNRDWDDEIADPETGQRRADPGAGRAGLPAAAANGGAVGARGG